MMTDDVFLTARGDMICPKIQGYAGHTSHVSRVRKFDFR